MAFVLPNVRKRRLRDKQRAPAAFLLPQPALAALADEAWTELTALGDDARRKHMHWVHVRTHAAHHRQPDTFSRESFWRHMERVYRDVYPNPANRTGSILLVGVVAKERHVASTKEAERAEHHHCPCYCSVAHYWRPVARRSEELGVKLHAAVHDGYTIMYVYLRNPNPPKKPLQELDAELWYSEDHPRGEVLNKLLDTGLQATRWLHKRRRADGADEPAARFRCADLFGLSKTEGIRTVAHLRERAHAEATHGDMRLAEFCTVHKEDELQAFLDNAWAVHEAPQRALSSTPDRVAKLRTAAGAPCTCGGVWEKGVSFILRHQDEDVGTFCSDVLRALALGPCRGVNLAIIGPPGCGKSTVFEALDTIYAVCGKPQRDSTFPFNGVMEAEVLLWQEFAWESTICAFEDLLSLMVGEKFGIRVPGKKTVQHRNTAPMFYTAWEPLTYRSRDARKMMAYKAAMDERFNTRIWSRPLPSQGRVPRYPQCGRCFACFVLGNS